MSQVHIVPNSGFQLGQVSSIEEEQGGDVSDEDEPHEDTAAEGEDVRRGEIVDISTGDVDTSAAATIDMSSMHVSDTAVEEPAPPSASDMDALMLVCLLRSLKYIISIDDLPLLVSSLWNTLMR